MNSEDREQIRLTIIRRLDERRWGVPTSSIVQMIRWEGFSTVTKEDVEIEIHYLVEKGLVSEVLKSLSPENKEYRITAEGRDFRATKNL